MTGGGGGDDEVEADLAAFGIARPANVEEDGSDDFEVFPENWETVQIFTLLDDSWRRNPCTGRIDGLRWETAESVMRMMGVVDQKETYLGLKVMAVAAMPLLNRK